MARRWIRYWLTCDRVGPMLRFALRFGVRKEDVVLVRCLLTREWLSSALDDRPRVAIDTAERWARGEATLDELKVANEAAYDAYLSAHKAKNRDAELAAIFSSGACGTGVAKHPAIVANFASDISTRPGQADLVRKHITLDMLKEAI